MPPRVLTYPLQRARRTCPHHLEGGSTTTRLMHDSSANVPTPPLPTHPTSPPTGFSHETRHPSTCCCRRGVSAYTAIARTTTSTILSSERPASADRGGQVFIRVTRCFFVQRATCKKKSFTHSRGDRFVSLFNYIINACL